MRLPSVLLLLGLFLACSSTRSAPGPAKVSSSGVGEAAATPSMQGDGSEDGRVQELYQRFQSILAERIKGKNIEVSNESGLLQRELLLKGAQTLVRDRAGSEAVRKAEQDVVRFADALIENATPTETGRRIGESTFAKVYHLLCPLYPFC